MFEEIVEVIPMGEMETYDLEIYHKDHTFYANDISVSNSHAVSYSIITYQCAWLFHHYPAEWCAAFLDSEMDKNNEKREAALTLVKSVGYDIIKTNVNHSGEFWEVVDEKKLAKPLTFLKGVGTAAVKEIEKYKPFNSIEEFMFHEEMKQAKNKRVMRAIALSGAFDDLIDERFNNLKHFVEACIENKSIATKKISAEEKLSRNIENYENIEDYTEKERIKHLKEITGDYPIDMIVDMDKVEQLKEIGIPPLSEYDSNLGQSWFVLQEAIEKLTKNNKKYLILKVIDTNNVKNTIKVWGVRPNDEVYIDHLYVANINKDKWGFSIRNIRNLKVL